MTRDEVLSLLWTVRRALLMIVRWIEEWREKELDTEEEAEQVAE